MAKIISIETSTALCSVAFSEDGIVRAYRESNTSKSHASLCAVFVQEVLEEAKVGIGDCDAVCVSMGPGSYTGLRVGVSTAKGLCFGSGKPLLAIGTMDTLVAQARTECEGGTDGFRYIVPMVDARRMEVYSAIYSIEGTQWKQIGDTAPVIVDEGSFGDILEEGKVLFIGDGAGKCADVIRHPNASFIQCCPDARAMAEPAEREFLQERFRDVAYFEPFYLKEFVATVSKKKLF